MSKQLNDLFDYGYMIYQDSDYFKFSLDSVLLAEFTQLHKGDKTILDMCTGNAAVAMILQKKYGNKVAVDDVSFKVNFSNEVVSSNFECIPLTIVIILESLSFFCSLVSFSGIISGVK